MIVECCDLCLGQPVLIFTDVGQQVWYIICDLDGEPAHLMDDLELKFLVCLDKYPERLEGREYYCGICIEKMWEEENERQGGEDSEN